MNKARRRSHGEGAVYRRASDGRWVGSLNLGYVDGRRRRKQVYGHTEREVITKLNLLHRAAEQGQDLSQTSPTLSQWLDQWLEIKSSDGTRASTLRSYRGLIENHVRPTLGRKRLDKLTPADVRNFITAKSQSHLSPATVAHLLRLLRNTLGEAERLDLVSRNVAKAVKMPRVPTREVHALDVDQARTLLTVLDGHRLHALFATTLVLGLRRGEVLGLSWSDIDPDHSAIRVRHSLQRLDGSLRLVETKTRASTATLAAPPSLMAILARHRVEQQRERLALGAAWPELDLVFTSTTGTALEPRNVTREWDRLRTQAGLPHLRLHDLRHSCATILTALGVHPRVVMEMLRHSQIGMTMNTYAHVTPLLQRDAADALEAALFG
jgi:integrase